MNIDRVGRSEALSSQKNMPQVSDVESKGLQKEIAVAQQQLQKLSANEELTAEEKKQKRQEVQKEIADLNRELRRRQAELHREQLKEENQEEEKAKQIRKAGKVDGADKISQPDDKGKDKDKVKAEDKDKEEALEKEDDRKLYYPLNRMERAISSDSAQKQARAQKRVAKNLENSARVIESEIRLDEQRGQNTERKEAALEDTEQRSTSASETQMEMLSNTIYHYQRLGWQGNQTTGQQDPQDERKLAEVIGAPQKDPKPTDAAERYNAEKMFSSVIISV